MKLNHVALAATEVVQTGAMLETYFGLRRASGPNTDKMAFFNDDDGALLTIFRAPDVSYPKIFHIGFMQPTRQHVRDIHERLTTGGFAPEAPREEHGRLTFYFQAPGGFTIEVDTFSPT